jgi:hypothetical protein
MNEIVFKTFMTFVVLVAICSLIMLIELSSEVWRERATKAFMGLLSLAIVTAVIYLFLAGFGEIAARELTAADLVVLAHDPLHQRADLNEWFNGLHSQGKPDGSRKASCCSNQDGALVKDAEWDTYRGEDGISHYKVMIEQKWYNVPDEAVVTEPNKYGPAMVWGSHEWYGNTGGYNIRCFMPGMMG